MPLTTAELGHVVVLTKRLHALRVVETHAPLSVTRIDAATERAAIEWVLDLVDQLEKDELHYADVCEAAQAEAIEAALAAAAPPDDVNDPGDAND